MNKRKGIFIGTAIGVVLLAAGYLGVTYYLEIQAKRKVDDMILKTSEVMDIVYRTVDVDLIGWDTHIRDVTLSPVGEKEGVKIEDIAIYRIREHKDKSLDVHLAFNGINIRGEPFTQDIQSFGELDYRDIKADLEIDYRYQRDKKELILDVFRLEAENMGTAEFSFHLSKFELEPEKGILMVFMIPRIQIHRAKVTYTDNSLVTRVIRMVAKKEGKTPEQIIRELADRMDQEISQSKGSSAVNSLEAFKRFIEKPGKIVISIAPKEPVAIRDLMEMETRSDWIKRLNIEARNF
jgi:hypothetical protein